MLLKAVKIVYRYLKYILMLDVEKLFFLRLDLGILGGGVLWI